MQIDYVQFYVDDARSLRDWFTQAMGFWAVSSGGDTNTQHEVIRSGSIHFVLSSPRTTHSPVHQFLQAHPPGVVDVAFRVSDLEQVMHRAVTQGALVLQPICQFNQSQGRGKQATIAAWGTLQHTLTERTGMTSVFPQGDLLISNAECYSFSFDYFNSGYFSEIDHIVLNVAIGDLNAAVRWYRDVLGFEAQQRFEIQTNYSGLCSRVMQHPKTGVRFPINEPSSESSQIQEFLDLNRGAGVQHIALQTENLVSVVSALRNADGATALRQASVSFLQVPPCYYDQLRQRDGFLLTPDELDAIADQQVLVDWQADMPEAILLQTFTQPIFQQPTFFFELIERRQYCIDQQMQYAQGFGEGNFRALFEAIEREQFKRGSQKR
ncbi:4-hydroxyphenylpyruvate dioxygenase [Myxacorys almedinensis]|uniref:4-hydroxyphenylpyruvate dioxygenase n=1 Tax=Myxacorys almedinensis A TaxID=2690445 RepID=A0A8J8CI66_9CYAN|nr:4-hydroxyphenylpyruvate dioxygenase [Myxacorys almedinensis]NDJ16161.1 4-hydroxyphenylpyruvate dioxygenase [Myxacorys almedinensis A]